MKAQNHKRMQSDRGQAFRLDESSIVWIKRFHEGVRWAVKVPVFFVDCEGHKEKHHIAQDHHNPVTTCQNPIEHQTAPQAMVALEVKVKSLVVRSVSQVMAQMSLANEMKWGRKK